MAPDRQPSSHLVADASAQADAQPWLDLEMHQLSVGDYRGQCTSLTLDGMHLVHEQQNQLVHKSGVTRGNLCAISIARTMNPGMRFSHFLSPQDFWLYFLPSDAELDLNVAGGSDTFYLCLDQDRLLADMHTLSERDWSGVTGAPQAFSSADTDRVARAFSRVLHGPAVDGPALSANGIEMLRDSVLLALNGATELDTGGSRPFRSGWRTQRLVSTAREFMDACLQVGRVPSVADLCVVTGVSERTLQYAFRSAMQLTPVAYLRTLRLNRVRVDLLRAIPSQTTVTRSAMQWGFVHLGEFARDYQRLFGERPSHTLARRGTGAASRALFAEIR
ncbi:helix-turn-helix domain-containing protein [Marinobacter sp.]|uniref:helix-turn-helix domain-containing protein n=1 Tax=Marinobacter sp. TaxID=50741 RepID=UPI003A942287